MPVGNKKVKYITLADAAKNSPYSQEYLSLLARRKKLFSKKIGRNWFTTEEALQNYIQSQGVQVIFPNKRKPVAIQQATAQLASYETPTPQHITYAFPQAEQVESTLEKIDSQLAGIHEEIKKPEQKVEFVEIGKESISAKIHKLNYVSRQNLKSRWRTMLVMVCSLVLLLLLVGGTSFGNMDALGDKVNNFFKNADALDGHFAGRHANEVLILDQDGKINISGHIVTEGQLRSHAEDGVAPLVVDSKTLVENLNAQYFDSLASKDFTLAFVTKNGNITYENVRLEGNVEVGKTLTVRGATKLMDELTVHGTLGVFGDAVFGKDVQLTSGDLNIDQGNLHLGSGTIEINNTQMIANLNSEFLQGLTPTDFTLDRVIGNGNSTNKVAFFNGGLFGANAGFTNVGISDALTVGAPGNQAITSIFSKYFTLDKRGNVTAAGRVSSSELATDRVLSDLIPSGSFDLGSLTNYWDHLYAHFASVSYLTVNNNLTVSGSLNFNGGLSSISSNLDPSADNTYDLGAQDDRWRVGYFGAVSASKTFGSGLTSCTGASQKLNYDPVTGTFSCANESGITGIKIEEGGNLGVAGASIVNFDFGAFNILASGSEAIVKLDYINGPASRSIDQTITGNWTFSGTTTFGQGNFVNASISQTLESSVLKATTIENSTGTLNIKDFTLGGSVTGSGNSITGLGQLTVDNITLDNNSINTTSGNLTLQAAGTSIINLDDNIAVTGQATFGANASVSGNLEVAGNASASALYGAGLSTCTGSGKLLWSAGLFSCGSDISGSTGSLLAVRETPGAFTFISSLSFDSGAFNVSYPNSSEALIKLDYTNGPASRSIAQTITGKWDFANNASFSQNIEIGGYVSASQYYSGGLSACSGNNFLQWTGGIFSCAAQSTSSSGIFGIEVKETGVFQDTSVVSLSFNPAHFALTASGSNDVLISLDWGAGGPASLAQNEVITGNWDNTANPWADNEVADNLTISGGTLGSNTFTSGATFTGSATISANLELQGYVSASKYFSGGLSACSGTNFLQWTAGTFSCTAQSTTATSIASLSQNFDSSADNTYDIGGLGNTWRTGYFGTSLGVNYGGTLNSTLEVGGTASISGATTLGSTLSVAGNTSLLGTLSLTGRADLGANTSVSGTLEATGNLKAQGYVSASQTFGSGLSNCTTGGVLLWSSATGTFSCGTDQTNASGIFGIEVKETGVFQDTSVVSLSFNPAHFALTASGSNDVLISLDWGAGGPASLAQNEVITGNWDNTANPWADNEVADNLTISGGTLGSNTFTSGATFTGSATISANLELQGYVSASKYFSGGLSACSGTNFLQWTAGTFSCTAQSTTATSIASLSQNFDSSADNTYDIGGLGNTWRTGYFGTSLGVNYGGTLNSTLEVGGTASISGATTLGSTLSVAGNTSLLGTLSLTGRADLGANTSVSGTLEATGNLKAQGYVSASQTFGSNLSSCTGDNALQWNGGSFSCAPNAATDTTNSNIAFITLGNTSSLSLERALTGTPNQVIITDNGPNSSVVLSLPQDIAITSAPTFGGLTLSGKLNGTSASLSQNLEIQGYASASQYFSGGLSACSGSNVLQWTSGLFSCATGTSLGIRPASNSIDWDEFVDNSNLDANFNVASHGFTWNFNDTNVTFGNSVFKSDTNRLGLNTTAPTTVLEVQGTASASYGLFGALQVAGFSSTSYSRFGTAATTHSLSAASDLLISGKLEVDGAAYFDSFASVAGNFEASGYASASKYFGGNLTDCDADNQTLAWDASTGTFSCGDDDNSGISGIQTEEGQTIVQSAATKLSFNSGAFDLTASGSTETLIKLDYINGPASRSIAQTITAPWTFTNAASISPRLEIYNATATASLELFSANNSEKRFFIQSNATGAGSNDRLSILNGVGSELVSIASSGYVGIGTSTPTTFLHIVGTPNDVAADSSEMLRLTSNGITGSALTLEAASTDGKKYSIISTASAAGVGGGHLGIYDATAGLYRLVIRDGGNVGIGTSFVTAALPSTKLEVVGTASASYGFFTNSLQVGGVTGASTSYSRFGTATTTHTNYISASNDLLISGDLQVIGTGSLGIASASKYYSGGLSACTGGNFLQWTGGVFGCSAASTGALASLSQNLDPSADNTYDLGGLSDGWRNLYLGGVFQVGGTSSIVAYNRLGTATSGHGLSASNDLLIAGNFEVDGQVWFDANASVSGTLESSTLKATTIENSTGTLTIKDFTLGGSVTGSGNSITGLGQLTVDNITIDGNNVNTTSGNLTLQAAGTSIINLDDSISVTGRADFLSNASISGNLEVAGNASASKTFGSGLAACSGSNLLQWTSGLFSCASTTAITALGSLSSNFDSSANNTYDIGGAGNAWRTGYFGTSIGVNYGGTLNNVSLEVGGTGITASISNTFFVDATNQRIGIGTQAPTGKISVIEAYVNPTSSRYGGTFEVDPDITANNNWNHFGLAGVVQPAVDSGVFASGSFYGLQFVGARNQIDDFGHIASMYGEVLQVGHIAPAQNTVTTDYVFGSSVEEFAQLGTITNLYGYSVKKKTTGGTVVNSYGIYLDPMTGTNTYGVYQTTGNNILNATSGLTGIGTTSVSTKLEVGGTASASAGVFTNALNAALGNAATVSYSRFGTATTGHGLFAASDLLISGKFEVDGKSYFDSNASVSGNFWFTGYASASQFYGANLTSCSGTSFLQWSTTGKFSCTAQSTVATSIASLSQNFDPSADNTYDLGGLSDGWKNLYLGGVIQAGGSASITAYNRLGTSTTSHSNYISTSNDLLVSGDLEGKGSLSFAGTASLSNTLFVDSVNKRVGIFTRAPAFDLDIYNGAGGDPKIALNGTNVIALNNSDLYLKSAGSSDVVILQAGSTVAGASSNGFFVESAKNMGVGYNPFTATVSTRLEVNGTASASAGVFTNALNVALGSAATVSYSRFGTSTTTHTNYISAANDVLISGDLQVIGTGSLGIASASKYYSGGLSACSGTNFLQWTGGVFSCAAQSTVATSIASLSSNFDPSADNTYDLGGISDGWKNLYLGGVIQAGGSASITGYNRLGTSTTGHSNYISTSNDLLISGDLEGKGSISFAGTASLSNTLFVNSVSKRVGINTKAPAYDLDIYNAAGGDPELGLGGTNVLALNGSNLYIKAGGATRTINFQPSNGTNVVGIDGTNGFYVHPSFNTGLGYDLENAAVSTRLEVNGTASASAGVFTNALNVALGNAATVSYSRFGTSTTTHTNYISQANDLLISGDLQVIGTGSFSIASASKYYSGGLTTCTGSNVLQWSTGVFSCTAAPAPTTFASISQNWDPSADNTYDLGGGGDAWRSAYVGEVFVDNLTGNLTGDITVIAHLVPRTDSTYYLGDSTHAWRGIYTDNVIGGDGGLNIDGNGNSISIINGTSLEIDSNTITFLHGASVSGNLDPVTDNTYNIGDLTHRWKTGFFGTSIGINANPTTTGIEVGGTASVSGKVNFYDSASVSLNFEAVGYASASKYFGGNLSACTGSNKLLWSSGAFSCAADATGFSGSLSQNFDPSTTNTYDIGDLSYKWRSGYFGTSIGINANPDNSFAFEVGGTASISGTVILGGDMYALGTAGGVGGIYANFVSAAGGIESQPSLTTGDGDSGFYQIGNNNIGLSLQSVKRVDFGTTTTAFSTRVGIGKSSAGTSLDVKGTASASYGFFNTSLQVAPCMAACFSPAWSSASYSRFGSNLTSHSNYMTVGSDLLISGDFEVDSTSSFDGIIHRYGLTSDADMYYQSTGTTMSTDLKNPSTVADVGGGSRAWVVPSNASRSDDLYATVSGAGSPTNYLQATNFGFNIPTDATIVGVVATIERKGAAGVLESDNEVKLVKGGSITGSNLAQAGVWSTTETTITYGSSSNLWGVALTPSDVNASNFGFVINVVNGLADGGYVDNMKLSVYYTRTAEWSTGIDNSTGLFSISNKRTLGTNEFMTFDEANSRIDFVQNIGFDSNMSPTVKFPTRASLSFNNAEGTWLSFKDMSTNFGGYGETGAWAQYNSYFGEEFARDRADLATDGVAADWGDNLGLQRDENTATGCTSSIIDDQVNGIHRQQTGATNPSACSLVIAQNATTTAQQAPFDADNLPVVMIKATTNRATTNDRIYLGITNLENVTGATMATSPSLGIYFRNGGTSKNQWEGITATSATAFTKVTCPTAISTTAFALLKIEVRSITDVRFYVDPDNGSGTVKWVYCGQSTTNIPTSALGMTIMNAATATGHNLDVDYFRVWQDDNEQSEELRVGVAASTSMTIDYGKSSAVTQFYPTQEASISAGMLVSLDLENTAVNVVPSKLENQNQMVGIVSKDSGIGIDNGTVDGIKVAISGRTPLLISTANGPIHKGDYLTASSIPGVAVKATSPGMVVGMALVDVQNPVGMASESYQDIIPVVVRPQWYGGQLASTESGGTIDLDSGDSFIGSVLAGIRATYHKVSDLVSVTAADIANWKDRNIEISNQASPEIQNQLSGNGSQAAKQSKLDLTKDHTNVTSYSVDSSRAEVQLSGSGVLSAGEARVYFDKSFTDIISDKVAIRVILTPTGATHGQLYVTNKSVFGFVVNEAVYQDDITFDWLVIARQKGFEGDDVVTTPTPQSSAAGQAPTPTPIETPTETPTESPSPTPTP